MGRIYSLARASLGLGLLAAASAHAYTPTLTAAGVPVRWEGSVKLDLAGNPANQSGISDTAFFDAVVRGLQRWNAASGGTVNFDYWQGRDSGVYAPSSTFDGLSAIYFASNSASPGGLTSNVIGLTQVWYDTSNGGILETDVLLNDKNFRFTTDARDTSGYGSGGLSFSNGRSNVFIENVVTHELGHAFGLSHSGGLQSTMLFMESPEQAHLGCDELTAIRAQYPALFDVARGALSGQVVAENGSPLFGAHVLAVSRRRGTVLGTALTDPSGRFKIAALEPGEYFLIAEPFYAGAQSLPSYYASSRSEVCPGGRPFARTPLTRAGGKALLGIEVKPSSTAGVPTIQARCSVQGAAIPESDASLLGTGADHGFGLVDRFEYSTVKSYRVENVGGKLEIHALSYSLYSPVAVTLSLLDLSGREVPARVSNTVYEGDSGYVNYDAAIVADSLPRGEYILRIEGSFLDSRLYPAGPVSIDSTPFLVLTGSINEPEAPLASEIPLNARCRMVESFASYQSPPGDPPRHNIEDSTGFCGTTQRSRNGGTGRGGPPAEAIIGWFAPWAAIGGIWGSFRIRSRRSAARPVTP